MTRPTAPSAGVRLRSHGEPEWCVLRAGCLAVTFALLVAASAGTAARADGSTPAQPGLVEQEFIYESAPFPSCHASTLEEIPGGLIAAWFGGTQEGHQDVGIWVARKLKRKWSKPVEAANGVQPEGKRHPCWNPVLFQPADGPLMLFYKVGPSPSTWWGMLITSKDHGETWSDPVRLPDGILGPVKNKPVQLADGTILSGSSSEHDGWRWHMERSTDGGATWQSTGPLNDGVEFAAIQPTILQYDGRLQVLCRSRQGKIVESWSEDAGKSWSGLKTVDLPNPNSGLDAVTLKDGRALLVYNHTPRGRSPLNVAVSQDGRLWEAGLVLENQPGEYSYPAVIQTDDGLVHISYTWKRALIKHVVVDPRKLELRPIESGAWPQAGE